MKNIRILVLGLVALVASGLALGPNPVGASVDSPASVQSVERPMDHSSSLSLFSCAATRPSGFTSGTVNHSHLITAESVSGHIDAFDCEVYNNPGLDGAVWRTYYIYDNVDGGGDKGIIGPLNVTRF